MKLKLIVRGRFDVELGVVRSVRAEPGFLTHPGERLPSGTLVG